MIKETIEKLEGLKEKLKTMIYDDIYSELNNICWEYDDCDCSENRLYLLDMLNGYNIVSDDELEDYIIPNELKEGGLQRLRYFLNDCDLSFNLYRIDSYGNLENVSDDLFIEIIDELIDLLKNA